MLCTFWRCLRSPPGLAAASKIALFRYACVVRVSASVFSVRLAFVQSVLFPSLLLFSLHT